MNTVKQVNKIKIDYQELIFIKEHALRGFAGQVAQALIKEGMQTSRMIVHQEITSLKDEYNEVIINKAREILKGTTGMEYQPSPESAQ